MATLISIIAVIILFIAAIFLGRKMGADSAYRESSEEILNDLKDTKKIKEANSRLDADTKRNKLRDSIK